MIDLIRHKISDLPYNGTTNIEELLRIIGAAKFAFANLSRRSVPPYDDYYAAIGDLTQLEEHDIYVYNKEAFDELKLEAIEAIDKLKKGLSDKGLEESDSLSPIIYGQENFNQQEDIDFALLLVEQKYIDYFKDRPSHLPSQPHDRLFSHYTISVSNGQYSFQFWDGDTLPEYIQMDAIDAVKRTVGKYEKAL